MLHFAGRSSILPILTPWRKRHSKSVSAQNEPATAGATSQVVHFQGSALPSISRANVSHELLLLPQSETDTTFSPTQTSAIRSKSPRTITQKWGLFHLNPTISHNDFIETENSYPVDIVAVHGITGSAFDTWTSNPSGTFWLRDFLPKEFPGARVFSYGYPADVFFSKERGDIGTFARELLSKLRRERQDVGVGVEFRGRIK